MEHMWAIFGLYILYYLVLPLALIFLIWKIWDKKEELRGLTDFGSKEKSQSELKGKKGELKKLQVLLVVLLLLFIPMNNLISSQIQEMSIKYDRKPVGGLGGSIEYRQVVRQLGPSYNTDSIISEMETAPSYMSWFIGDIREEIDLESLTRIPGELTVYRLDKTDIGELILITYSYLSPLPITRAFTFIINKDRASLYKEDTIVYPLDPSNVDPF